MTEQVSKVRNKDFSDSEELVTVANNSCYGGEWGRGQTLTETLSNARVGIGDSDGPIGTVVLADGDWNLSHFGTLSGKSLKSLGHINLPKLIEMHSILEKASKIVEVVAESGISELLKVTDNQYLAGDLTKSKLKSTADHVGLLSEVLSTLHWMAVDEYEGAVPLQKELLKKTWRLNDEGAEEVMSK